MRAGSFECGKISLFQALGIGTLPDGFCDRGYLTPVQADGL